MAGPTPSRALMRRHSAAMKIIHQIPPDQRVNLLAMVVCGTRRINEAVAAAEEAGLPMPAARHRIAA